MTVRAGCRALVLAGGVLIAVADAGRAEYVGPFPGVMSVGRILKAPVNDQVVVLRGSLVSRLGVDLYQFKDGSGEIVVEIAPQVFSRSPVKPETLLEIRGQVETGWKDGPRIEVHDLVILPAPPRETGAKTAPQ